MRNKNTRYIIIYLFGTLLSVILRVIYYRHSHGVTDGHISYIYLTCLGAATMFMVLRLLKIEYHYLTYYLFNSSFVFFYTYTLLKGIYNIAYVESKWVIAFLIVSIVIIVGAIINEVIYRIKNRAQGSN